MQCNGRRFSVVGVGMLALLAGTQSVLAGAHTWDVNEVFSNADGSIQFIELREANGTAGETGLNNKVISADGTGKTFTIIGNVVAPTSNKFFLMATQSFADLPGAPTPDRIIPAGSMPFFNVAGDTVRYGAFDAWVFGVVPTDGVNSRNRLTGIAANSPTNYAGQTGSVNAAAPGPGDFDGDGDVDLGDFENHADCLAGPQVAPTPGLPDVTAGDCLDAFDGDGDEDVDLQDFADFQRRLGA